MYTLNKIKEQIVIIINEALGKEIVKSDDLTQPPQSDFGDLSLACFSLAKKLGQTPIAIAERLVNEVRIQTPLVGLKAVGPYVNFTLDKVKLAQGTIKEIIKLGEDYGANASGRRRRVMIEYSNANTHKEYHVGHLRNLCLGEAVSHILSANGWEVIPVSYINDFGIHIAKTLWAYQQFYQNKSLPKNKGYFLGQVYARAVAEMEKDPLAKEKVTFLMRKIESRSGPEYRLWQKTRKWSLESMEKVYREMGIKFSHTFYESQFIEAGRHLVEKLYHQGFLKKSEGAIIADLNQYGLGVLVFLRSDGTALYPVADIPLAVHKFKNFKLNRSIYVVDTRQSLYFKQLFKILELLKPLRKKKMDLVHLAYEFVKLPTGMMSSRTGNIIAYQDLRDQVFNRALAETKKRHKEWSKKKQIEVAEVLTRAAIKFEMIKVGANQVITFDINQALRFDGFTAAYLQYTYARIGSIIKKYNSNLQTDVFQRFNQDKNSVKDKKGIFRLKNLRRIKFNRLGESKEYDLILKIAKYPEVVAQAGGKYEPAEIAKYLFSLTRIVNDYYHTTPILKAETETRLARLALAIAVRQVIANGLALLGIEVVEEM
jgi:arginyl-tRNA synthetase